MADKKTSLIVRMTDDLNGVKSKSVVNVNPDATLAELQTFAQGLAGLTDHSYVSSTKVEQTDTDYVEPPVPTKNPWEYPFAKMTFSIAKDATGTYTQIATQDDAVFKSQYNPAYAYYFVNVDKTNLVTHADGKYSFYIKAVASSVPEASKLPDAESGIVRTVLIGLSSNINGATSIQNSDDVLAATFSIEVPDTFTQTLTPTDDANTIYQSSYTRAATIQVVGQAYRTWSWDIDIFPYHGGTN